jgi:dTDP-4-dehydrorhamnose 3,5-epimerase
MQFHELSLAGAFLITLDPHEDDRGFFARIFSASEFGGRGLPTHFSESSLSFNKVRGTVRGMHLQSAPYEESKLVRCVAGAVYDVVVDLRRESQTYLKAHAVELSSANRTGLYIPKGMAHGFQTRRDDTELLYMIDTPYHGAAARGVRWNDPALRVVWPEPVTMISERDLSFPDWTV